MKKLILLLSFLFISAPFCLGVNWNVQDGINLYNKKDVTKSKEFFESYTKIYPNNPIGFYYLGLIYKDENNLVQSKYNLEHAYNLTNDITDVQIAPEVKDLPVEDYLDMANMFLEENNLKSALEYANLIQDVDPDNKEAYLLKTEIYLKMEKREASYDSFLHVLEQDPSYLDSDWAKMLQIDTMPQFSDSYYNSKGLQYFYVGEYEKAVENFNKALEINPKNDKALSNLGNIYLIKNDITNADSYFKRALSCDKNNISIYKNLAITDRKNAEKYLKQALSKNPNDKSVYYGLGKYYNEQGDLENSIVNFKKALSLDKSFVEVYLELIPIYIENKKYDEAIKNIRYALNTSPDNAEIYYFAGFLSERMTNYSEAAEYYSMAIKNAKNKNYYKKLSEMYLKLGDNKKAQETIKEGQNLF